MKRLRNCIVALLLGCCAPVLIWVGAGAALRQRQGVTKSLTGYQTLTCATNIDCPPGFVCMDGRCIRQ